MALNDKKEDECAICETESAILTTRYIINLGSAVISQYGPFLTLISRLIHDPFFFINTSECKPEVLVSPYVYTFSIREALLFLFFFFK